MTDQTIASGMTSLGMASTHDERQLEAAIRLMPAWRGFDIAYAPVSGGISNMNWRVSVSGLARSFFCKIPGAGTEMFIDRNIAHEASLKAAATGYGVPVVAFLEASGAQIFDFLEGWRASSNRDFLQSDVRLNALQALQAFHHQPALAHTKTVFDMIDEHQQQVQALNAVMPPDHAMLDHQYRRARAALEASGLDLCPCMNDTLAGNFMLNDANAVRLVDFEYASNNDRCYELALWFGEMFFEPDVELALIEAYFGRVDAATVARVMLYKALADLKWATWSMVQLAVSTIAFDYYKYGIWKTMRARGVIQHPQWETWLKQV